MLPQQTFAQTRSGQKTELTIHHHAKKAVSKKHHTATVPLSVKKKLVQKIIGEHLFALRMVSLKTGFSAPVLVGIIGQESKGDSNAIGADGKGSLGLGQTRPIANKASGIECDSFNPICSIKQIGGYLVNLKIVEKIEELPRQILGFNSGPSVAKKSKNPERNPYVRGVAMYMRLAAMELQEKSPF